MKKSYLLLLAVMLTLSTLAHAQDEEDTAAPNFPALQLHVERLELEAKARAAEYPAPDSKGLNGDVTAKNVQIIPMIQAYRASRTLARTIAKRARSAAGVPIPYKGDETHNFVIGTGDNPFQDLATYQASVKFLDALEVSLQDVLETLKPNPQKSVNLVAEAVKAKSLVGNIVDLLAYFKSDISYEGFDFELNQKAIAAQLCSELLLSNKDLAADKKKVQAFYLGGKTNPPSLTADGQGAFLTKLQSLENDEIKQALAAIKKIETKKEKIKKIDETSKKKDAAKERIDQLVSAISQSRDASKLAELREALRRSRLEFAQLKADLDALVSDGRPVLTLTENRALKALKVLTDGYDSYKKALYKVPDGSTTTPLQKLVALDALYQEITQADASTHFIYLEPVRGGGVSRTIKNVFNSGSISYNGAAIISYFLFDKSARMLDADTVYSIRKYQRIGDEHDDGDFLEEASGVERRQ